MIFQSFILGNLVSLYMKDLKNPFILIHENKILDKNIFAQAIGAISCNEVKRPLLVVANDVEEEVAGFVVTNETFSKTKVKVTNNEMIIHGGSGNQVYIEDRCEQLSDAIEMSTSDYEIKLLEERLQMLSSRVAILKVGGATTAESRKKRKRATNALNAAKAAMEEGIIPGGGVALLHASEELEKLPAMNIGEKIGVKLLQHAVKKSTDVL
ncbi:hypothetical protein CICLE_v10023620mg [Citrus x clementina]|uniref:Uncharacterized protein n=1 Tax=Citrus clementina TaxID=85681 RepID=V4T8I7_CITCL|nr:hypothetical protein CICLE_v10023620mg [Citrus x clementina]